MDEKKILILLILILLIMYSLLYNKSWIRSDINSLNIISGWNGYI